MKLGDCIHVTRGGHPAADVEAGCIKWEPKKPSDAFEPAQCGLCRWFQERPQQEGGTANARE